MQPNAFTCAIALALCTGLLVSCGKDPDRDMAKEISRAAPPPQPSTSAPSATQNTPANLGAPSQKEKEEGRVPQQGQVDPKESKQHKDFQQDTKPGG